MGEDDASYPSRDDKPFYIATEVSAGTSFQQLYYRQCNPGVFLQETVSEGQSPSLKSNKGTFKIPCRQEWKDLSLSKEMEMSHLSKQAAHFSASFREGCVPF